MYMYACYDCHYILELISIVYSCTGFDYSRTQKIDDLAQRMSRYI